MGLDMYLEARISTYKPYGSEVDPVRVTLEAARDAAGLPVSDNCDYIKMLVEVAYWRKANQIHAWFVENIQEGRDECQTSYVPRDRLVMLRDLCANLLKTKDAARALRELPPQSGFFFGSTDIDDYYWSDLQDTVDQLDKVLALPETVDIYYRASW